jgi:acetone carboxylase gamma subunit
MHFLCTCGHSITDRTDFIEYKASLIPDRDGEDLVDRICAEVRGRLTDAKSSTELPGRLETDSLWLAIATVIDHYTRTLYQCPECGRLHVDDPTDPLRLHPFVPEGESFPRHLLRSVEGDRWKRPMGARWSDQDQEGVLWWHGSGDHPGGHVRFDDWEHLEQRYFEVFHKLLEQEVVRSAFLRRGQRIIHSWPEEPGKNKASP